MRDRRWVETFGSVIRQDTEHYGKVVSLRVHYASQLEVEFGLTDPSWAAVPLEVLFERDSLMSDLGRAAQARP